MNKEMAKLLNSLVKRSIEKKSVYIDNIEYEKNKINIEKLNKLNYLSIEKILIKQENRVLNKNNQLINLEDIPFYNIKYKIIVSYEAILLMANKRLENKGIKSGHDRIIYSLIKELKKENDYLFFSNFEIKTKFGFSRPDLYIIQNTDDFNDIKPICYEIKHSRSDFLSDIKKVNKRSSYLEISPQLYYVCPYDVIKISEVPEESGLIYMKSDGNFEEVKKAPVCSNWKNNFNISFLNTLIMHKSNENIDIFLHKKSTENSVIKEGNFNELCLNDDVNLLNKNQLLILDRFSSDNRSKSFKEFHFMQDCVNSLYDLIGLGIIKIEEKMVEEFYGYINNNNNKNLKAKQVFGLTEVGKRLVNEINKFFNDSSYAFVINQRKIYNKLTFFKVIITENVYFDFYIANKNKNIDKINLTGCIRVKNKEELSDILNNDATLDYKAEFCQKIAFVNFENNIDKKDIPSKYSLYNTNNYYFSSSFYPKNEVKRGKKKDINDVNKNIFIILLREEYNNKKCFLF